MAAAAKRFSSQVPPLSGHIVQHMGQNVRPMLWQVARVYDASKNIFDYDREASTKPGSRSPLTLAMEWVSR